MRSWRWSAFAGVVLSVSFLLAAETKTAPSGAMGNWSMQDVLGRTWTSEAVADSPILVMAFWGVECPLAQLYAPELQRISDDYRERGVRVVMVNSNRHDTLKEMAAFSRRQKLSLPFLKDLNNVLADHVGAERTPEVFVFDSARVVRYHGRVDDRHNIGGRSRPATTRADLRLAIDDLLAGREVAVPKTPVMGCLIGKVQPTSPSSEITYAEHVAPILRARCVECHRAGEIGPFSLTDYEQAAGWASMMAEVTQERRMPPWHADPKFGSFANERRLTDDELATLQKWAAAGAPAGDLSQVPPLPTFTQGWQLPREPDLVVNMREQPFSVPAEGEVAYQYFLVDPQLREDKWIATAEVIPGNRSVVHHVIVFATQDGRITDDDGQMVTAYVPGMRSPPPKKGYAKRIPAGTKFIFQLHYTPNGTPQTDQTKIGLIFADPKDVQYEVRTASTRSRNFVIQPHKADQAFVSRPLTAPADVQLLSFMPHMHLRGQSFRYEMTWPDGRTETMLDIPRYDFNWQTSYRLKEPLTVPRGAKLTAYASFDNSTDNLANPDPSKTVRWGDQSWDEMLIGYFDIAVPRRRTP